MPTLAYINSIALYRYYAAYMYVLDYNVNIQTVLPSGSEGPRATINPLIMAMNNGIKRKYKQNFNFFNVTLIIRTLVLKKLMRSIIC